MFTNISTILCPTDFGECGRAALGVASSLAREYDACLLITHIVEPRVVVAGGGFPGVMAAPSLYERDEIIQEQRIELQQVIPPDPSVHYEHRLDEGAVSDAIVREAQETHADLIVMGTHGRSGLKRLLMGSIAEDVIRRAPCPVVTVRSATANKSYASSLSGA